MKFVCDQCKTKYSIDDARVRGKVLKIRCKQCDHIITVREETASRTGANQAVAPQSKALSSALDASFGGADFGDGAERTMISTGASAMAAVAAAATAKPAAAPADDWFISFDGEQEGPLSLDKVVARIKVEIPKGKESHAWRDGFDSWLAIADVPEIQRALKAAVPAPVRAAAPVPRPAAPRVAEPVRPATAAARAAAPAPAIPAAAARSAPTPAIPAAAARSSPTPAIPAAARAPAPATPAAAQRTPARPAARPFEPGEPTMMEMQAPSIPAIQAKSAVVTRSSPAAAAAAAQPVRAPAIDTTPAPLPAPPMIDPAPPVAAIAPMASPASARIEPSIKDDSLTPLPPPAVPELLIGEPSVVMRVPGGLNGQAAAAAPVVIITGPGSRGAPWLKWALAGGGVVILLLLGAVGYLLFGKKPPTPVVVAQLPTNPGSQGTPVEDRPPAVIDPGAPPTAAPPAPVPAKGAEPKAPIAPTKHGSTPKSAKPEKLTNSQAELQKLYGDVDKGQPAHDLPKVQREEKVATQVSESQLREVVSRNKQSLTFCYERVLKRDTSLRNARVDIEVKVGISGSVTKVAINEAYNGSEIGNCLTQAIKRWHFPSQDSEYSTAFPLLLQAQ